MAPWARGVVTSRVPVHNEERQLTRNIRRLRCYLAWLASEAPIAAYMNLDLSTGLDRLLPLVALWMSGQSELALGSRLASGAKVVRRDEARTDLGVPLERQHLSILVRRGRSIGIGDPRDEFV